MDRIADAGAGFHSITENIDTTTPASSNPLIGNGRVTQNASPKLSERPRKLIHI
jgi:hypothetical protein